MPDEEIPFEGRGHNKALHVFVKCMDHIVAKVLFDNGSSLNIIPKSTLDKLPFNVSHLRPSSMIVRTFDGTHRNIIGDIDLPVQIGPHTFQITFLFFSISSTWDCWINSCSYAGSFSKRASIDVDAKSLDSLIAVIFGSQVLVRQLRILMFSSSSSNFFLRPSK